MTQPVEVAHDLVQPRFRIWRFAEPGNDGLDELAGQPRDALIFSTDTGSGLIDEPRDVDGQTKRENERKEQIDPGAQ